MILPGMGNASSEKRLWRQVRWYLVGLGLLLLVATFLKMTRLTTNPRSRVITVQRLVDDQTWSHAFPGDTTPFELSIDAVQIDGRLYSSKPPNYPAIMAGEAMAVHSLTGMPFYEKRLDYLRVLVILNQILPYLLLLGLVFSFLRHHTHDPWTVWFMLLALGPAMLAFGYAATINNHTVSATLYTIGFILVHRIRHGDGGRIWHYALIGLMAGLAFSIELPSGGLALGLLALLFLHAPRKAALSLPFFLLPIFTSLLFYQYISGDWRPFQLRSDLFKFEGSYWNELEGIDAEKPSKGAYIFHMLVGFRGLFSMTPVLVLGVIGLVRSLARPNGWLKREWQMMVPGILALMVFVVFNTWNYGGDCIGMRWFICFSPLLMLAGIPVVEQLGKSGRGRLLAMALLLWSIPWNLQALFEEAFVLGWFDTLWGR